MRSFTRIMPTVAASVLALAGLAGLVGQAEALVELNMVGSSAGKQFATDVPLNLCDQSPTPHKFVSADGNKIVWTCHMSAAPADDVIMRYNATQSSDGIITLQQDITQSASKFVQLDHLQTTSCSTQPLQTRASDSKTYNLTTGCANTNLTLALPVHMGASDVQGSSFHQSGNGLSITSLDDQTGMSSTPIVVVPWGIFLGKNVVKADGTPVTSLSRYQVEAIFNRAAAARDWKNLGLATNVGGSIEATSPIVVCLRNPGSGSKAAFDETVMIILNETGIAGTQAVFSGSSGGVEDCLKNNPRGIGYLDADQELVFTTPTNARFGDAYMVALEGTKPRNSSLTDQKQDLKCGRYPYWAMWRLNARTADAGTPSDILATAFKTNAGLDATIQLVPTGAYWSSDEAMAVGKNADRGPITWKAGAHPECNQ
jgi:hypothetical protein